MRPDAHSPVLRIARGLALAVAAMALTSCGGIRFYTQAVRGQWQIMHRARPITDVLADPSVSTPIKKKLNVVLDVRSFGEKELGLRPKQQYTDYADLGRKHVVWVVFAAPEFSVDGRTWWYPLVGPVGYRGFFREIDAEAFAATLRRKGDDVFVGGVDAYSTLGWLRDPVLNTFVGRSDPQLADVILHELTHQRCYVSGDTDFNEALATAFAEHGVRRWLTARGRTADLRRYTDDTGAERAFISLALATRERLRIDYAQSEGQPAAVRRHRKDAILAAFHRDALGLRREWPRLTRIDQWFAEPVTNARLNTLATYYDLVPDFEAILRTHPNDPEAFFQNAELLAAHRRRAGRSSRIRSVPDLRAALAKPGHR